MSHSPLIELNLSGNNLDDQAMQHIGNYLKSAQLQTLDVSCNSFGPGGLSVMLRTAHSLVRLSVDYNNL
jgi:hypothetical protein